MARKPSPALGCALVMSRRTFVVDTGSKVTSLGWPEALASVTCGLPTGAQSSPFQYSTATSAGSAWVASTVKVGRTLLTVWADGHATDTHSRAWARLNDGSRAVACLT